MATQMVLDDDFDSTKKDNDSDGIGKPFGKLIFENFESNRPNILNFAACELLITDGENKVGRIPIPNGEDQEGSNPVIIDHPAISRQHAVIDTILEEKTATIKSLKKVNPVHVQRSGTGAWELLPLKKPQHLKNGDRLKFSGLLIASFEIDGILEEEAPTKPPVPSFDWGGGAESKQGATASGQSETKDVKKHLEVTQAADDRDNEPPAAPSKAPVALAEEPTQAVDDWDDELPAAPSKAPVALAEEPTQAVDDWDDEPPAAPSKAPVALAEEPTQAVDDWDDEPPAAPSKAPVALAEEPTQAVDDWDDEPPAAPSKAPVALAEEPTQAVDDWDDEPPAAPSKAPVALAEEPTQAVDDWDDEKAPLPPPAAPSKPAAALAEEPTQAVDDWDSDNDPAEPPTESIPVAVAKPAAALAEEPTQAVEGWDDDKAETKTAPVAAGEEVTQYVADWDNDEGTNNENPDDTSISKAAPTDDATQYVGDWDDEGAENKAAGVAPTKVTGVEDATQYVEDWDAEASSSSAKGGHFEPPKSSAAGDATQYVEDWDDAEACSSSEHRQQQQRGARKEIQASAAGAGPVISEIPTQFVEEWDTEEQEGRPEPHKPPRLAKGVSAEATQVVPEWDEDQDKQEDNKAKKPETDSEATDDEGMTEPQLGRKSRPSAAQPLHSTTMKRGTEESLGEPPSFDWDDEDENSGSDSDALVGGGGIPHKPAARKKTKDGNSGESSVQHLPHDTGDDDQEDALQEETVVETMPMETLPPETAPMDETMIQEDTEEDGGTSSDGDEKKTSEAANKAGVQQGGQIQSSFATPAEEEQEELMTQAPVEMPLVHDTPNKGSTSKPGVLEEVPIEEATPQKHQKAVKEHHQETIGSGKSGGNKCNANEACVPEIGPCKGEGERGAKLCQEMKGNEAGGFSAAKQPRRGKRKRKPTPKVKEQMLLHESENSEPEAAGQVNDDNLESPNPVKKMRGGKGRKYDAHLSPNVDNEAQPVLVAGEQQPPSSEDIQPTPSSTASPGENSKGPSPSASSTKKGKEGKGKQPTPAAPSPPRESPPAPRARRKRDQPGEAAPTPTTAAKRRRGRARGETPEQQPLMSPHAQADATLGILFSGVEPNTNDRKKVEKIGGMVIEDRESYQDVTHLIAAAEKCNVKFKRTPKVMALINCAKHVLDLEWLYESARKGFAINEEPYTLSGTEVEQRYNFVLKESIAKARVSKLLEGRRVCVTDQCCGQRAGAPPRTPPEQDVRAIVALAGGEWITLQELLKFCKKKDYSPSDTILVSHPNALKTAKLKRQIGEGAQHALNATVYLPELIFTGVLRQSLDFGNKDHILHCFEPQGNTRKGKKKK